MLKPYLIKEGAMNATVYDFEDVGDILPAHVHDATNVHYTFVMQGELTFFEEGKEPRKLIPGSIVRTEIGIEHHFVASKPKSRIVNVIYGVTDNAQGAS